MPDMSEYSIEEGRMSLWVYFRPEKSENWVLGIFLSSPSEPVLCTEEASDWYTEGDRRIIMPSIRSLPLEFRNEIE